MTNTALRGKPDAENPHVRFDEGEVASCTEEASLRRVPCRRQPEGSASGCAATPRRGSLLYRTLCGTILAVVVVVSCASAVQDVHLEDAANQPAKEVSSLPEMLLIGDSIRLGYCGAVAEALRGKAEVKWPVENCQNSQTILISLVRWRGLVASPKVVHFNCGHWDAAHWDGDAEPLTSVEEYARNVRKIIHRIRRYWPEAKIVFATTTTMNPTGKQGRNPRTTESIRMYNAAAVKVAKEEGVAVNDLFAITEKWPASDYADYCHFNKEAAKRLGCLVADRLALESVKINPTKPL